MSRLSAAVCLLAATALACHAQEAWRSRVQPENPGPVSVVRPFSGEFRFGWSEIEAARAKARIMDKDGEMQVLVEGGTKGFARTLWKLDASYAGTILKQGLQSVAFRQVEKYAKKTITTQAVFKEDSVWRRRDVVPDPKGPAKWKRIKVRPVRDIVAAMFFVRSQPLENGDKVGVIAFPGDDAYLAEIKVAGREDIRVAGKTRRAIKLQFQINKVVRTADKKEYKLEPHKKFKNGTVWVSDDADRIPLRAEVNIFIGYVFGELASLSFEDAGH